MTTGLILRTLRAGRPGITHAPTRSFFKGPMPTDTKTDPITGPIHILGVGNLGKFVAHSLVKDVACPVTLLFHRENLQEQWEAEGRKITCITDGVAETTTDFAIEVLKPDTATELRMPPIIENLVVATKAYNIVPALSSIRDRLDQSSNILLLHNGMGTVDEVTKTLFGTSKRTSCPTLWTGITSAGIHSSHPFTIIRAGLARVLMGPSTTTASPHPFGRYTHAEKPPLIQALLRSPTLDGAVITAPRIYRSQLQKLAVNAVINPFTALTRCKNRLVASDDTLRELAGRLIAEEIGPVVRALLKGWPDHTGVFSDDKLFRETIAVARWTGKNTSSMLQDVQAGRRTEVDYINGFLVREGKRMGMIVKLNERLVELVKAQPSGGGTWDTEWTKRL